MEEAYAACRFRSNRFCCFSSFFSVSSLDCRISESMLLRFLSAGMSKRAFFFRMPSCRIWVVGEGSCELGLRTGRGRGSVVSEEVADIHPPWLDCGDMGMADVGSTASGIWLKVKGLPAYTGGAAGWKSCEG